MTILWLNLALVFMISFFSRYFSVPVMVPVNYISIKPNKILIFGTLISLVAVSGLRNNIGDTFFYMHAYSMQNFTWDFITSQKDIGFGILQMILKRYTTDPQLLVFITALITNVLIVTTLYKHSRLLELSLYVYITGGLFLVSMNGMRQMLAASIIFSATYFLFKRKWFYYIVIVSFASTFHESALLLIPIYFMVGFKAWSKSTMLLLAFAIIIALGYNQFSNILFSAIKDTQYGEYQNFSEGGANIIRVAVEAVPLLIAFLGREKLRKINSYSDYIVNMALIGFVFMIISTQNWIFARFAIYFSLYQLLLISWIIKIFNKKDQKFVYLSLLICYFAYYYYENVVSLNIIYKSNFLTF
ncbi:EpsG family protein [Peribacillus kribbensis]|uniref:EpsG family protein n=1 Tax=Peribacillus kribbensis TaxID=356658 RepID=UPI000406744D|nr:EpsG family protein [Peribacillus kribbensis]